MVRYSFLTRHIFDHICHCNQRSFINKLFGICRGNRGVTVTVADKCKWQTISLVGVGDSVIGRCLHVARLLEKRREPFHRSTKEVSQLFL